MTSLPDRPKQCHVFLWCWPRSISTCFEKCLSFVDDVQVWHEPYWIAYMREAWKEEAQSKPERPHLSQIEACIADVMPVPRKDNEISGGCLMPIDNFTYPWIKSKLEEEEPDKKYIFIKDCAYSIYNHQDALPNVPSRHTFLIRHPYRIMSSYRRLLMRTGNHIGDTTDFVLPEEEEKHLFNIDYMHLLWRNVQESGKDPNPIIIDAEDLMNYPEMILSKYLGALDIPFRESYTTWDASAGSIKTWKGALEWLVYGKQRGVFDKAFVSSRFLPETHVMPRKEELTPDITGIINRIMPGYEEMYDHRLKPE